MMPLFIPKLLMEREKQDRIIVLFLLFYNPVFFKKMLDLSFSEQYNNNNKVCLHRYLYCIFTFIFEMHFNGFRYFFFFTHHTRVLLTLKGCVK
jgi:hypothetical protein